MAIAAPATPTEIPRHQRSPSDMPRRPDSGRCTIWGHTPAHLHDACWRAHSFEPVRIGCGERCTRASQRTHFLLLPADTTLMCNPAQLARIARVHRNRRCALIELHVVSDSRARAYTERVIHDIPTGRITVRRSYGPASTADHHQPHAPVFITTDRALAQRWAAARTSSDADRELRQATPLRRTGAARLQGQLARHNEGGENARTLLQWLISTWTTIGRDFPPARSRVGFMHGRGPVWLGYCAQTPPDLILPPYSIVPDLGTPDQVICAMHPALHESESQALPGARLFDIIFASLALIITLPLWPVLAMLIKLEDGGPVFFAHERQGHGGRPFQCLKFRTMRPDAELRKDEIAAGNVCDGAQFFIRDDPRQTRVGRWLRKMHLDELPQFINVLRGEMSVVGPRPSPEKENRYCPAWREARLNVRPGITGLWQVRRTRAPGRDFQEWIRHDIDYVQTNTWRRNLGIVVVTIKRMFIR